MQAGVRFDHAIPSGTNLGGACDNGHGCFCATSDLRLEGSRADEENESAGLTALFEVAKDMAKAGPVIVHIKDVDRLAASNPECQLELRRHLDSLTVSSTSDTAPAPAPAAAAAGAADAPEALQTLAHAALAAAAAGVEFGNAANLEPWTPPQNSLVTPEATPEPASVAPIAMQPSNADSQAAEAAGCSAGPAASSPSPASPPLPLLVVGTTTADAKKERAAGGFFARLGPSSALLDLNMFDNLAARWEDRARAAGVGDSYRSSKVLTKLFPNTIKLVAPQAEAALTKWKAALEKDVSIIQQHCSAVAVVFVLQEINASLQHASVHVMHRFPCSWQRQRLHFVAWCVNCVTF